MTSPASLDDVERELNRVVDRLNSVPLAKAESASADVQLAADVLLAHTRTMSSDVPADATLPRLGPQGLGALISVLGRDCLDAMRASSRPDLDPVLDALVALRRALP